MTRAAESGECWINAAAEIRLELASFDDVDWVEMIEDMDDPLQFIREIRLISW